MDDTKRRGDRPPGLSPFVSFVLPVIKKTARWNIRFKVYYIFLTPNFQSNSLEDFRRDLKEVRNKDKKDQSGDKEP